MEITQELAFFDRTRYIGRWTGQYMADRSNVAAHIARLQFLKMRLTPYIVESAKLFLDGSNVYQILNSLGDYLTLHDVDEVVTGDIPHVAKRDFPELKVALEGIPQKVLSPMAYEVYSLAGLDSHERDFVLDWAKLLDQLDFTFEAHSEIQRGNRERDIQVAWKIAHQRVLNSPFFAQSTHRVLLDIVESLPGEK